jgi:hypothetical protein
MKTSHNLYLYSQGFNASLVTDVDPTPILSAGAMVIRGYYEDPKDHSPVRCDVRIALNQLRPFDKIEDAVGVHQVNFTPSPSILSEEALLQDAGGISFQYTGEEILPVFYHPEDEGGVEDYFREDLADALREFVEELTKPNPSLVAFFKKVVGGLESKSRFNPKKFLKQEAYKEPEILPGRKFAVGQVVSARSAFYAADQYMRKHGHLPVDERPNFSRAEWSDTYTCRVTKVTPRFVTLVDIDGDTMRRAIWEDCRGNEFCYPHPNLCGKPCFEAL